MPEPDSKGGIAIASPLRYQPLVLVFAALSAGIVWDRHWPLSTSIWSMMACVAGTAWLVFAVAKRAVFATPLALSVIGAFGGAWHHERWYHFPADDLGLVAQEVSQPICVEVTALTSPRWRPAPPKSAMCAINPTEHSEIAVWVSARRDGSDWRSTSGYSLLRVNGRLEKIESGDRLRVFGRLYAPSPPSNPGEMDFAEYERAQRRLCRLSCDGPEFVEKIASGSGWGWRSWIDGMREKGVRLLWSHIKEEDASLASALLLGAREQLDQTTTDGFFLTGIIHLLAISGLHVGILAFGFWWLTRLSPLPRRLTLVVAAALVVLYAVLTDMQPPVMRAAVLIVCLCAARWLGRTALAFNTLAAAGIVVLCLNPASLFQVGAQLSFLAVAALASWSPSKNSMNAHDPLTQLIERTRPWPIRKAKWALIWLWNGFLTSAMVWAITTPLVWYRFHLISPIALLLNPLVMLPTTLAMYSGFGVLLLGFVVPPLGNLCGYICGKSLEFIQRCIDIALTVPLNYWFWPAPPLWWVLAFYAALGALAAFPSLRPNRRLYPVLWILAMTSGVYFSNADFLPRWKKRPAELHCTFIAVGHGTSVLIEFPNGAKVLYDAGRVGMPEIAARPIAAVLWSRGITHLDAIIVSHADTDHFNAIPELLRRFSAKKILMSPMMFRGHSDALDELRRGIARVKVPIETVSASDEITFDESVRTRIIHPPQDGVRGSDNANSIVLVLEYAGRRILLPGDLESPGLDAVLAAKPMDADIVMAPHHGSKRSHPEAFARWSTPEWVVISGSRGKDVLSVREAYSQAGGRVFHTAVDGAVRFKITDQGIEVFPTRSVYANPIASSALPWKK